MDSVSNGGAALEGVEISADGTRIGFLQMKRWGHQWMIVTCWMGVLIWCVYVFNMTMYADVRFAGTVLPVVGWWLYDIFYITPFLAIPYLHSVNREIFSD